MDSVLKARNRFRKYPEVFGQCRQEASLYASCVLKSSDSVNLNSCSKEFKLLKNCLLKSATGLKTRL